MAQDDPYTKPAFVGRSEIVQRIIDRLTSPDADRERQRSLIVEGPAGRGKSWLLEHIYQIFQPQAPDAPAHPQVVACMFRAGEDIGSHDGGDLRWHPLIARICLALHPRLPAGALSWPLTLIDPSSDERTIARDLGQHQATAIFPGLLRQAEDAGLLIVLIVDSLEEIDEQVCADFESRMLVPLMRSKQVRLLTARRVDSRTHDWRKYQVRNQTKQEKLPSLDHEPAASEPPVVQQLERLIASQQEAARPGSPADQALVRRQREALQQQAQSHYTWGNPGVNSCLASKATDGFRPATIEREHIAGCLRGRLKGPREIAPPGPWDEQFVFDALDTLVQKYGDQLEKGVLRTELPPLLAMEIGKTVEFLAYLQELGIGLLNRDGSFSVHPEFVQLFSWLHTLAIAQQAAGVL